MSPLRLILLGVVAALAVQCAARVSPHHHGPHHHALRWLDRTFSTGSAVVRPTREQVASWLDVDLTQPKEEIFVAARRNLIRRAEQEARTILGGGDASAYVHPAKVAADAYPYWGFIPQYLGGAMATPTGSVAWNNSETSCFAQNAASLLPTQTPGTYTLIVTVAEPTSPLCSDFYLFATIDGLILHTFNSAGSTNFTWTLSQVTDALEWDLMTKGVRVFRFQGGLLEMLGDVIDTALLFEAEATQGVPPDAAARNIDFLQKYAGFSMEARNVTEVIVDESLIQSGDFFGIMRLDGMDTMLAWAMGSTTGHTTTALWIGGQLYVCESTAIAAHWPVNGVQKTPYRTWLAQVKAAGQNAVWAPLAPAARANYNETAAVEWFLQQEGLNYGYHTLLWGWLDTAADNYPCVPRASPSGGGVDWSLCLSWESFEVVFGLMDAWLPPVGDLLFNEAFNHRLGTVGLKAPELFMTAVEMGYAPNELPTIVEQDEWTYNTTRYGQVAEGRSLVCCVFVCSMWKAAGVFGDLTSTVQCGELTNWDDYALTILDAPPRPKQCVAADPSNPLCQIEGQYTVVLNDFATKPPYENMAETCGGHAPEYEKPSDC